ncbi:hypothetical protein DTO013E5_460 [Penicillium roqueforti]|uniref:Genomic scaffold, ProqFM164S02 n=1 Tax=Penicillium roqueforti (strain FM164) TaxID=1365484 RepID=W6Q4K4_PENRF|nr:uncharacterized protein LCP9604111_678 [Penicillium roqueforti]CDM30891.1 unnamed protein product [Penicillium roqueforti FM164]KAF9253152.1 hypothetical protein LCP9604111_678 [Penicillium roqueforti]KAI1838669.1 hypothetical protein CBS147337_394 [Penicillium roqueforti]KAI2680433.1 hypothetical protein CBS147355_3413 [Penicillium roqueforti]KAI2691178.1 hypothetical protein LCP963914a_1379 [Penicillium roqueforti]
MKLPKSFTRRKSSGNVLEEVESPHQSSFRVFERPGPHRSMTDGAALTKPLSEGNTVPMTEDSDNIFAERERPLDKSRGNYESSTSTRLSSSSTLPSSTEVPPPEETLSPHSRIHDVPAPPPLTSALRAAGRTFSFGGRFSRSGPQVPRQQTPDAAKNRPVTGSTDSTATPPKLPDTDFALGSQDDFNKMFDNLGAREGSAIRGSSPNPGKYSSSPPSHVLSGFQNSRAAAPAAINTDRSTTIESPPYSWDRRPSEEGLLRGPRSPPLNQSQSTLDTVVGFRKFSPSPNQFAEATTSHRSLERPQGSERRGLRRSGIYSAKEESGSFDDEDAKMVRQSVLFSKESTPPWAEGSPSGGTPLIDKGKAPNYSGQVNPEPDNMFQYRRSPAPAERLDPSIADHARLAVQYADSLPKSSSPGNKVMTPSQFEHYRQQQELRRSNSNATKSDDESDHDDFDDEQDEVEKQRETERQRRRQEAHLSVYRQQMMKITGQQAPVQSLRPVMSGASNSTPNLLPSRLSALGEKSTSGKSSEEEDDDVPLGILAAHGFPGQNRPPTRLNNVSSNPNLRASMQPPYISSSNSVSGADPNGSRGSLPPFARNLPRDPYFGAGLVNNANRESLAFGGGSVYGGSSSPAPPPGGLVGVIANEERARALRRGSPNTQAMHEMGGVPRPYSTMPPPQQQNVTAGEQASIQLSQQMANMMQMQMQWMQQVMQMQGGQGQPMMQGMPPMMMPGGAMSMPPMGPPSISGPQSMAGNPNFRPMSMPATSFLNMPPSLPPQVDQRTMSMLDPNVSARRTGSPMPNLSGNSFRPNTGYAASIAPSERSTAGMAPRYRPVSVMQPESNYAVASPTNKPFGDENHNPSMPMPQSHIPKSHLATVTVRPVSRENQKPGSEDEDDDDEAWADMAKKREKKKSSWKMKRGTSSFGDLLSAVH